MSKATENSKQIITLSLPLIEIDSRDIYNIDNYKEDGVFFVKSNDGLYGILDINRMSCRVIGEVLPVNAQNLIIEQQAENPLKDIFEKRFSELIAEIQGHIHHFEESLYASTKKTEDALQYRSGEIIEKLEGLIERIKQVPAEDVPKLIQGHISEAALVEILRTVK